MGQARQKLKVVSQRSKDKIPYTAVDGVHDDQLKTRPSWWTNGFWPGLMWVMYCGTKDDTYKEVAQNGRSSSTRRLKTFNGLHHDVGFMWHISSGMDYRLFGGEKSRTRTLYAANMLAARYNIGGGFLRAWNEDKYGWTIIDTMMNIPLLYWATKETGDPRYRFMAEAHADMAMRDHVRPDGSVNHIVVHDHFTGEVLETLAGQGYEVGSSWSRGVSWAPTALCSAIFTRVRKSTLTRRSAWRTTLFPAYATTICRVATSEARTSRCSDSDRRRDCGVRFD